MKSHRVILLGGKNNRQVVSVFSNRTTVRMPVRPDQETFAAGITEPGPPVIPTPLEIEVYTQRFFRYNNFKFTWWCLQEYNPQECLLAFTYPYGCNEIVAIRRTLPNHEKHTSLPIPHGWKQGRAKDPTQLLDQHSIEAVERYEERHRK